MRTVVLFFVCVLFLSACDKTRSVSPALQKVNLAYTSQPQSALMHIAIEKGFFRDEGLDVHGTIFELGRAAMASMLKDDDDIASVAETPIMYHVVKGGEISIFANIVTTNTNNGILARQDAGIQRPEDLKGKRVGFPKGSTAEFFLSAMLSAHGLEMSDIHPVYLKPNELQAAIMDDLVDAISIWNYKLALIADALGFNGIVFLDKELYTESFNLVCQPDYTKRHPEVLEALLRGLLRAEKFSLTHLLESQEIMARRTQVPLKTVQKVWPEFKFKISLAPTLLITLDDEARWALQNQFAEATAEPDFLSHIYFDALRTVKPEAIKFRQ
ncbi:ABC transporter substrate-binding protein [Undibacterium sp. Dicai25W]|uniref:ABC transporter substrate-binding protein n=1 Tax=Undibacterium sp. Dicai25W TaxID=3413034 RepID=UPI003BF36587